MSLPQPDLAILRKAQRGDERAFSIIVRTYETPVYNYVLRLVHDRSLAEDLTQEVFLRVFQGLPKFSLRCKFTTWLFQVTKNRVLDELRANERRPRALVAIDEIAPLEVLDAPVEQLEAIDTLWRAVDDLNPDLKMALLLRDVVGLPYAEIADALEVTLATVKWRIHKARDEVQLALAREGITYGAAGTAEIAVPAASNGAGALDAVGQPLGERGRQTGLADLRLRRLHVVLHPPEGRAALGEVEEKPGRTPVAVPRLPDRAGVAQPATGSEVGLGAGRCVRTGELAALECDGEGDVAVADEHERRLRQLERRQHRLPAQHVLPHGITRARMEEVGVLEVRLRLQTADERP